jgi:hypothetical protein
MPDERGPASVVVSPDRSTIAIANLPRVWALETGVIQVRYGIVLLDYATYSRIRVLVTNWEITSFAFDASSRFITALTNVFGSQRREGHSWRVEDGARIHFDTAMTFEPAATLDERPFDIDSLAPPFALARRLTLDGSQLRVSGTGREVTFDLDSQQRVGVERIRVRALSTTNDDTAVATGPDLIATAHQKADCAEIVVSRASEGKIIGKLSGIVRVGALAFAEDGKRLYAAYDPDAVAIIEL